MAVRPSVGVIGFGSTGLPGDVRVTSSSDRVCGVADIRRRCLPGKCTQVCLGGQVPMRFNQADQETSQASPA